MKAQLPGAWARPYHGVLVVDLDDNDGRVIAQLMGFTVQLQVVEHQHLVPGGAQGLIQYLQGGTERGEGGWVISSGVWADT